MFLSIIVSAESIMFLSQIFVNKVEIIKTNIWTQHGVVHVINGVLRPVLNFCSEQLDLHVCKLEKHWASLQLFYLFMNKSQIISIYSKNFARNTGNKLILFKFKGRKKNIYQIHFSEERLLWRLLWFRVLRFVPIRSGQWFVWIKLKGYPYFLHLQKIVHH